MPAKRKTTRRQFLKGESAVEALGDLTHGAPLPEPAYGNVQTGSGMACEAPSQVERSDSAGAGLFLHMTRRAMACRFEVILPTEQAAIGAEAAVKSLDLVEELEAQLSIFQEQSEISRINRRASDAAVPVESRLFRLLRQAAKWCDRTGGAMDVTAGPLSKVWGFFRRQGRLPDDAHLVEALRCVGSRHLEFSNAESTLRFTQPGMEINLGAIGKGYALDRSAELLEAAGVGDFLLHAGQSSVLARGGRIDSPEEGWSVGLPHPLRPDRRLGRLRLCDRALGTSGSARQFFHHQGRRYGHVLDPRTGRPAEGLLSATVLAPTATLADALSTAFFVMGPERAAEFCRERGELAAVLVCDGGRGSVEVKTIGLTEAQWQAADGESA